MRIFVGLSARLVRECDASEAYNLGQWIARNGHTLVYGGHNKQETSLMQRLCCGYLDYFKTASVNLRKPLAVHLEQFYNEFGGQDREKEVELVVRKSFGERMQTFVDNSDMCLIFKGGMGTLEELTYYYNERIIDRWMGEIHMVAGKKESRYLKDYMQAMYISGLCPHHDEHITWWNSVDDFMMSWNKKPLHERCIDEAIGLLHNYAFAN